MFSILVVPPPTGFKKYSKLILSLKISENSLALGVCTEKSEYLKRQVSNTTSAPGLELFKRAQHVNTRPS